MPGQPWPENIRRKALSLYIKGKSAAEINRELGPGDETVRRWAEDADVKRSEREARRLLAYGDQNLLRKCPDCGETNLKNFSKLSTTPSGKQTYCLSCSALRARRYRWNTKRRIVEYFGGKCIECGIDDIRVLQVNHLKGSSFEDRRFSSSHQIYAAILREERNRFDYDLRCANCNILYDYEIGKKEIVF